MSDKARLPYVGVDDANEATRPLPQRRPAAGPPTGPTSGLPPVRPAAAGPSDSVWPASEPAAPGQPDSLWPVPGTSAAVPSDSVWPDPEPTVPPSGQLPRRPAAGPQGPGAGQLPRRTAAGSPAKPAAGQLPRRPAAGPQERGGPPAPPAPPARQPAGRHRSPHRLTLPTDAPPLVLAVGGFACQASDDIAAEIVSAVRLPARTRLSGWATWTAQSAP